MKSTILVAMAFTAIAHQSCAESSQTAHTGLNHDIGNAQRIESAELLRVFTQEAAAAACFYHNGVAKEISREMLVEARDGFDRHYNALMNGDEALGIVGPEERRMTRHELQELDEHWQMMAGGINNLLDGQESKAAFSIITKNNLPILKKADQVVGIIETEYSNPAQVLQADIMTMDIAARQATLSQRMVKNACAIWSGHGTDEIKQRLKEEVSQYDVALSALLNGMPELGVRAAPNAEIETILKDVMSDWQTVRPIILASSEGQSLSVEGQEDILQHMKSEMSQITRLTHAYALLSKRQK